MILFNFASSPFYLMYRELLNIFSPSLSYFYLFIILCYTVIISILFHKSLIRSSFFLIYCLSLN